MNESEINKGGDHSTESGGAVVALPVAPMNGYDAARRCRWVDDARGD